MATATQPQQRQASPQQINQMQRQAVLSQSVEMIQSIYSGTISPTSNNLLNINPRNVGLIKKFIVEIVGTLNNTSTTASATLTDTGIYNLLSNVTFLDLNNNTRINTTGYHLGVLSTAKRRKPFASCGNYNTANTNNLSQGVNVPPASWPLLVAPPTIAEGTSATVRAVFEVPLAYSDDDLRGAIYANVINANMQLSMTFNQNAFNGGVTNDYTNAVYFGTTGTFSSATINVYQVYLDQLPVNQKTGQVVLPIMDLSTIYELKNTNFSAISTNNDFPIPYANFRDFQSTILLFNNNGMASGRAFGTDINYLALQSANFTNIFKVDPLMVALWSREIFNAELPAGTYYFSHRKRPISTTQFGNMELIINPSVAASGAYAQVFWEDFALVNTLVNAGSLAG